ncbi:MAG: hypothetical protein IIA82_09665 [Thaumarchaeota archaeon]|nr:hypothetical protein [Nitrososphaerota archaeon]
MTNATVKPTLFRIEQKLDKLTNLLNKENSEKDDGQENEGQIIEMAKKSDGNGSGKSIEVCDFTESMANDEEETEAKN